MGKNFAICIGINTYDNFQNLNYAKRDAELMCDYFKKEAHFEEVYYFSEDAPPIRADSGSPINTIPSIGALNRFLRIRFEEPFLSSGDNFWFFFAGHGLRYQERDYLMPYDADPGNIDKSGISIYYVTEQLRRCGADNIVLLIDACRSQGYRNGIGIGGEHPKGVITIFACSPNESSYEIDALQQGSFTHTLLNALRMQGEENCATVERLDRFLLSNVPALNQRYGKPIQTPYTIVEPRTKAHLVLLPKQATKLDIAILREDAREAELEGDIERAEHLWKRVLAISPDDQYAWKGLRRIWSRAESDQIRLDGRGFDKQEIQVENVQHVGDSDIAKLLLSKTLPELNFSFDIVNLNAQGEEVERRHDQTKSWIEDLGNGLLLELIYIPSGSFVMGSPQGENGRTKREIPQHVVTVRSFLMGRYLVTQSQWNAVSLLPRVELDLQSASAKFKGATHPIECVSWYEAIEFCNRLSRYTGNLYRLPSEAEWEYACRAGTTTPFHFGETIRTSEANYHGEYPYGIGPIGKYRNSTSAVNEFSCANGFGLSDMHGNVLEWCQDIWHENYNKAPTDGRAWMNGGDKAFRITRGGAWNSDPAVCRSAYRSQAEPDSRDDAIGFRVVIADRDRPSP